MKVELLQNSSLVVCAGAVRTCWQSQDKSDSINNVCGEKDKALIDRVGNKFKHASTLEHLTYTFYISGVSRALLQELARHRVASLSVKSTRYTLKELKECGHWEENNYGDIIKFIHDDFKTNSNPNGYCDSNSKISAEKFLVLTGIDSVDQASLSALNKLSYILKKGVSNDKAKYCLPESYKTELTWTINARSLQNFISLRSNKSALWEIQNLAKEIYNQLPNEHKFLFEEYVNFEDFEKPMGD